MGRRPACRGNASSLTAICPLLSACVSLGDSVPSVCFCVGVTDAAFGVRPWCARVHSCHRHASGHACRLAVCSIFPLNSFCMNFI